MTRYPLQPLLDAAGVTLNGLRQLVPMNGSTYRNAREHGLTEQQADRYACALGLVPWSVWPEWLHDVWQECAHPDCSERFLPHPKGNHRRFCSHRCRRRYNERRARELSLPSAENKREYRRRYYAENGDYERARQRRYDQARRAA